MLILIYEINSEQIYFSGTCASYTICIFKQCWYSSCACMSLTFEVDGRGGRWTGECFWGLCGCPICFGEGAQPGKCIRFRLSKCLRLGFIRFTRLFSTAYIEERKLTLTTDSYLYTLKSESDRLIYVNNMGGTKFIVDDISLSYIFVCQVIPLGL